ncbi:hypothetical protein [Legionella tucsonensis]|uniref:Transmembrane protein n=1 Tax=Legionella tucsonensis TaxID=40335 RepID=A0A0W0ZTM7_9GAMM|nr:hypothetical protein [Legionella tucsonensis]KTD72278.1 transmembrane protein [Legionella tucsonensis]
MKFKQVMSAVAYLPANALTGLTNLVLGSTVKEKGRDGVEKVKIGRDGKPVTTPGLVGYLAEGIKFVSRSTADFLSNHKKAIATAFWLSLLAAGAVALTLFLWPAALTAVATFSVAGLSIAAIAGASTIAQIGLAAALTAAAVSVATYVTAAAGNLVNWIAECCKGLKSRSKGVKIEDLDIEDEETLNHSHDSIDTSPSNPFTNLGQEPKTLGQPSSGTVITLKRDEEVPHFSSPLRTSGDNKPKIEVVSESSLSLSKSQ